MRIPEEIISEIKYKNPIEEVVSSYVNLKRSGHNLSGLCPFHNEKTPSFTVYPDTSSFYCFGCGAGGDVFTFISKIENLDYIEAVKNLAQRSGITVEQGEYDDSLTKLKARIIEINKESARFFNRFLFTPNGKWALEYLTGRGLTEKTINHFGLGAAPNEWDMLLKHLKSKGFSIEEMLQANVITKGQHGCYDRFRNRTVFPIIDLSGRVIGFSGRRHPDEEKGGKYVNTSDTPVYKKSKTLFGLNFAKGYCSERLLIVEGNMDVVSLHQAGFKNTIGTLGTAFTPEQASLISRYTKEVILGFDSDAAGQKAANRAMEVLSNSGLSVKILRLPDGKDPDEFIKNNGAERFEAVLNGAVSEIEFKLFGALSGIDITTNDGQAKYLNSTAQVLSEISDSITVDLYAGKLADKYNISKTVLLERAAQLKKLHRRNSYKKQIQQIIRPKPERNTLNPKERTNKLAVRAEKEILSVLMAHPDLYLKLRDFGSENFISPLNKRVFSALEECYRKPGSRFDISHFGSDFTADEMAYMVSLQNTVVPFVNPERTLNEAISTLKNEAERAGTANTEQLSYEDWKKQMQKMIESKRSK